MGICTFFIFDFFWGKKKKRGKKNAPCFNVMGKHVEM